MNVQIFGVKKSADTRKALRFFSERRIKAHFVDLTVRPASRGELRRFVQRFGIDAVVARGGHAALDLGLHVAQLSEDSWLRKLEEHPELLRLPLVRSGKRLTVGADEEVWREWVENR